MDIKSSYHPERSYDSIRSGAVCNIRIDSVPTDILPVLVIIATASCSQLFSTGVYIPYTVWSQLPIPLNSVAITADCLFCPDSCGFVWFLIVLHFFHFNFTFGFVSQNYVTTSEPEFWILFGAKWTIITGITQIHMIPLAPASQFYQV